MLSTVLNIIMFEDCRNQWSMSRPLLGLILLNEEVSQRGKGYWMIGRRGMRLSIICQPWPHIKSEFLTQDWYFNYYFIDTCFIDHWKTLSEIIVLMCSSCSILLLFLYRLFSAFLQAPWHAHQFSVSGQAASHGAVLREPHGGNQQNTANEKQRQVTSR